MAVSNQSLKFHSEALGEDALLVLQLHGEERLSGLFRFELDLISTDPALDLDGALYQPAKLGILQRLGPDQSAFRWYQGTLAQLEEHDQGQGWTRYRAVLVPDLWRLSECWRSRVFQDLTTDELVSRVLQDGLGLQGGLDFDFKLTRTKPGDRKSRPIYPEREYVVQYMESDLDFIQRWLEHEGIWYRFENDGEREKVVFADSSGGYLPVYAANPGYPYRPEGSSRSTGGGDGKQDAEDVLSFRCRTTRQPGKVELDDYNWRDPQASLRVEKAVHEKGSGIQREYNNHYKTPAQGSAHAEVRAEEWSCRGALFSGESTCRGFRPGGTWSLQEHFRSDWNRKYLLTSVSHRAEQSINLEASNVTAADYRNAFECIPADREFRPERTLRWPQVHGLMHGRIDGEGQGQVAELDEFGRYKVRLPWDENARHAAPGKASRWVRMAQPYAGAESGFHFPLLKGTEVILTHVDGDPDRPIITGAVPDRDTVSLTNHVNPTQNKIQTPSGNVFQIDDHSDRNGFVFLDANRTCVQDFRRAGSGAGGAGQGGGGGGERRGASAAPPIDPVVREKLARWKEVAATGSPAEQLSAFKELVGLERPEEGGPESAIQRLIASGKPLSGRTPAPAPGSGNLSTALQNWLNNLPLIRPHDRFANDSDEEPEWSTSIREYLTANADCDIATLVDKALPILEGHEPSGKKFTDDYQLWARRFDAFIMLAWGGVGEVEIKNCNQYSYVDNSMEAKYSTGGTTHDECYGETTLYEIKHEKQTEDKKNYGDKVSTTFTEGTETSTEIAIGATAKSSIKVDAVAESEIHVGASTKFSLDVGVAVEVEIKISAKAGISITIGAEAELKINVAAKFHADIVATYDSELKLSGASKFKCDISTQRMHIKVPKSTEVLLEETQAALKKTDALLDETVLNLNMTENRLFKKEVELDHTVAQLSEKQAKLSKKVSVLDQQVMALNVDTTKLQGSTKALSNQVTALSSSSTAAIHTIS